MKLAPLVIAALALSSTAAIANADKSAQTSSTPPSQNQAQSNDQGSPTQSQGTSSMSGGTSGSSSNDSPSANSASSQGSSDVRDAQQALQSKGFDVGSIDGQMGPKTEAAIKQFQQKNSLDASGQLDAQTLAALGEQGGSASSSAPSSAAPTSGTAPSSGSSSTSPSSSGSASTPSSSSSTSSPSSSSSSYK
jgi:peptidoglycan hydrolase-like protein with peptidoglycan-binding domain